MKIRDIITENTQDVAEGSEQDYLSQIPNLTWKPVNRKVWNTIQDEGLDEEQDTPNHSDWLMASLSISPKDAQALQAFDDDTIENFNRFDIHLKSRYPGFTDLIDYDRGTVTIVKTAKKQGVAEQAEPHGPDMATSLRRLGKFYPGRDPLAEFVPERASARYALHPDKWQSTFYSLTNKDPDKLRYYGPTKIAIPPGTLVGDMAIANQFYRAKTAEEKQRYAELYQASLQPYPVDVSKYRMPELLMPRQEVSE